MGRDEQITAVISDELRSSRKGPVVGESLILGLNARQYDYINWFEEARDKIVLRPGVISYYAQDQLGSINTVTNCYESADDDSNFGNHNDDESTEEERDKKINDAFHSLTPTMHGIYGMIKRESDLLIVKKHLNAAMTELLQKHNENEQPGTGITSLVSFPQTDERRNDTRKRPATSPDKRGSSRK